MGNPWAFGQVDGYFDGFVDGLVDDLVDGLLDGWLFDGYLMIHMMALWK